jgi:hypothetical protein
MFDVFTVGRFTRGVAVSRSALSLPISWEEVTSAAGKDEGLMLIGTPPWPRPTRRLRVG